MPCAFLLALIFSICRFGNVLDERPASGGSGSSSSRVNMRFFRRRPSQGSVQVVRELICWRLEVKPLTFPSVLCSRQGEPRKLIKWQKSPD